MLLLCQASFLALHDDLNCRCACAAGALNYVTVSGLLPDTVYFYKVGDLVRLHIPNL